MHNEVSHRLTALEKFRDKLLKAASYICLSEPAALTQEDLHKLESHIMSAISDFATAQNAFNDQLDTAVAGLTADIKALADQIAALQGTAGQITAEDQALLDAIQARVKVIADKLTALDSVTPPVVPVATR